MGSSASSEVAAARRWSMRNALTSAGTITTPPPTPNSPETSPVSIPTPTSGTHELYRLDARCTYGRVVCADKTTNKLYWVIDGQIQATFDARFGAPGWETADGNWIAASLALFLLGAALLGVTRRYSCIYARRES